MLVRWDTTGMRSMADLLHGVAAELDAASAVVAHEMHRLGRPTVRLVGAARAATWSTATAADLLRRSEELDRAGIALDDLGPLFSDLGRGDGSWVTGFDLNWTIEDVLLARLDQTRSERVRIDAEHRHWWESEAEGAAVAIVDLERRLAELAIEELRIERALVALVGGPGADEAGAELDSAIAYLGYELAGAAPSAPADVGKAIAATREIRSLLDESRFGDVSRLELLEIGRILGSLGAPEFNAVVAGLNDNELYRWFHELDGIRGGNLTVDEETLLFETVAKRGDGDTLWRLANAEFGERFIEIADAVSRLAPAEVAIPFIARCAAEAAGSDAAAAAALVGIDRLAPADQQVALIVLSDAGLLAPLLEVADGLVRRIAGERDDSIPIEVLEGLVESIWAPLQTVGGLTIQGLWDRHAFRRSWSQLGRAFEFLFGDPVGFIRAVIDLEGLVRNPARWLGAVVPAVALTVVGGGAVARLGAAGRLGWRARHIVLHVEEFVKRVRVVTQARWADGVGAIVNPRVARLARQMGVRLDSLVFEYRHLTVNEYITRFCDGSVRREIPAELLWRTLEEVLMQSEDGAADLIRDLLLGSPR